jgi:SpoVK/Ycf46/Vps4 family AAA+-type ATPase
VFDRTFLLGKTLTARILASQCEIPLIVLKLETIVSKWYGDAEKKLAQVSLSVSSASDHFNLPLADS